MMKKEDLKIGDRIRLIKVPDFDQGQPKAEADALSTVEVLSWIIEHEPVVMIDEIDEYGQPWFSVSIEEAGETSEHTIAIMDDDSWEKIGTPKRFDNPEMQALSDKIDRIMQVYEKEYDALAKESEALYDARKALEQKYKALDDKTGLNDLFRKIGQFYK